jgi:AraC-like DNA-binding protein
MVFDFYDIIHAVIFFQLSVLIVVLLLKGGRVIPNRILAFFLFAQMVASMNGIWWNHFNYTSIHLPWLCHIGEPFFLLWGPLMYLYIVSRNEQAFKLQFVHLFHFLPSFVMIILLVAGFHRLSIPQKVEFFSSGTLWPRFLFAHLDKIVIAQVAIYNLTAIVYQERVLKKARFRNKLDLEKIKWNRFILWGYFVTCMLYDVALLTTPRYLSWEILKHISFLLFAAYFTAILYKAIVSNIFTDEPLEKSKRNLLLPESDLLEIVRKAESVMRNEKPFLNFEFGLKEMAEKIDITERLLSQAVNECRNQNINDFINSYRIEEAKLIIAENNDPKKTFLEVAFESGFNSKSSFYLVFKKSTGVTPSEFKKQHCYKVAEID